MNTKKSIHVDVNNFGRTLATLRDELSMSKDDLAYAYYKHAGNKTLSGIIAQFKNWENNTNSPMLKSLYPILKLGNYDLILVPKENSSED